MTCSVEGCNKPPYRNGMCNAHRLRLRKHGRLHTIRNKYETEEERRTAKLAEKKRWYEGRKQREPDFTKKRYWKNAEENRRRSNEYAAANREAARVRAKQWRADNPERKRANDKKFNEANPALVTSYKAMRRARERNATPPWLTEEHRAQIAAFYEEARRLTEETGIKHEVDHIEPLSGKTVCGLHVPWNLRVITRDENNRRPRVWAPVATALAV